MAGTYSRTASVLILGGGPAGYMAAIRLGQLGIKALLIERDQLGGECLNRGCIPSKALIHASGLFYAVGSEGPEIGVLAEGLRFDMGKAQTAKQAIVAKERQGVQALLKGAGATVLQGEVRFSGPRSAQFVAPDGGMERIDFQQAIIATGSVPASFPGFEPDGDRVLTAWQLLDLPLLPSSFLILGGGVSGCELGEFLAEAGVHVTIVELMPQLLPGLEPDLSREITEALTKRGVRVLTGTKATKLNRRTDSVELVVEGSAGPESLTADRLFLTVGKRPASETLDLETAGVYRDPKSGFVSVNDRMQTNVPHIYAAGDVARPPMLAHKAYREGIVAAEAIAGKPTKFEFQVIPSVVFTTPELASVGWSLFESQARGYPAAREVRFPYAALGRAHAAHATRGWVKLVADGDTELLLGVHAAGAGSGEYITEAGLALEMGATVRDVAATIHPHPTFSEALQEAALLWLNEPMHVARRREVARR
jgi:dihydrolipoamide dehydrogenase